MILTCLECDEPVEKLGDLCPEHAPDYADNDNRPIPWADETDPRGDAA